MRRPEFRYYNDLGQSADGPINNMGTLASPIATAAFIPPAGATQWFLFPRDINEADQVIANTEIHRTDINGADAMDHFAFITDDFGFRFLDEFDAFVSTTASTINEHGEVVGSAINRYRNPVPIFGTGMPGAPLFTLPTGQPCQGIGFASSINETGTIVGSVDRGTYCWSAAAVWLRDGTGYGPPRILNDLVDPTDGWDLQGAIGVSEGWQLAITGYGLHHGKERGFLLRQKGALLPTAAQFSFSPVAADPVNTFTGEFILDEPPDLVLEGPLPLLFSRHYASNQRQSGMTSHLGGTWRSNLDWTLGVQGDIATVTSDLGRSFHFRKTGTSWAMTDTAEEPFQLREENRRFSFYDPRQRRIYHFDIQARLSSIDDGHGNALTLFYVDGRPVPARLEDGRGRSLQFTSLDGRITNVSDGVRTVSFEYAAGDLARVIDIRGLSTRYAYGSPGRLVSRMLPDASVPYTQVYDAKGRVTEQTDALGAVTHLDYQAGRTLITEPGGIVREHVTRPDGTLASTTDGNGLRHTIGSDAAGRRSLLVTPGGSAATVHYDPASGLPAEVISADGAVVSYEIQPRAHHGFVAHDIVAVTLADGARTSLGRDAAGRIISLTDPAGFTARVGYGDRGQMTSVTNASGAVTTWTHNDDGTAASVTSPAGHVTTFGYDAFRRRVAVHHPDGTTDAFVFDDRDALVSMTNGRGGVTAFTYDDDGQVSSVTDAGGSTLTLVRDVLGRVVRLTDVAGHSASGTYDAFGRVATTTNRTGEVQTYTYDARGLCTGMTDAGGFAHRRIYDDDGHLVLTVDPLGRETRYGYDVRGRLVTVTAPSGAASTLVRDVRGRVTAMVDPTGAVFEQTYDPRGFRSSVQLPGGPSMRLERDALGNTTRRVDPNGSAWNYAYDGAGLLVSASDPLGRTTAWTHDSRGRPATITLPDGLGVITLARDGGGAVVHQSSSDGLVFDLTYDTTGRLTGGTGLSLVRDVSGRVASSNGMAVARDAEGRPTSVTLAPGKSITYAYNPRGLVASVTDWTGGGATYGYDDAGRMVSITRSNGVTTRYRHDTDDRLVGIDEDAAARLSSIVLARNARGDITASSRTGLLDPAPAIQSVVAAYDAAHQRQGWCKVFCV